jgi:MFS family permease
MTEHLRRTFGLVLLAAVFILALATTIRAVSGVYLLANPGAYNWSVAMALMVAGALILAVMFPGTRASRVGFAVLALVAVAAFAASAAPALGLASAAPLAWRAVIAGATSLPVGVVLWLVWSFAVPEAASDTGTDTEPKPLPEPKPDRKMLSNGRHYPTRIRIDRVPAPRAVASTGTDTGGGTDTETNLGVQYATLKALVAAGGVVALAAEALGVSPAAVNKRLRKLYAADPRTVEQYAPDWVRRNIGAEV